VVLLLLLYDMKHQLLFINIILYRLIQEFLGARLVPGLSEGLYKPAKILS